VPLMEHLPTWVADRWRCDCGLMLHEFLQPMPIAEDYPLTRMTLTPGPTG
jgi:hypothetical protein